MSNRNTVLGGLFLYVPVIVFGLVVIFYVFYHNYKEGVLIGTNTPPPAEGRKSSKAAIDLRALATDASLAAKGKTLFMTNCASCHGTTGKGDGDRAASLNPKPRNYTNEKFKFGDDIHSVYQTLIKGSPGTSMPSFALLPQEDLMAMSHYVRALIPDPTPTSEEIVNQFPAVEAGAITSSAPTSTPVTLPGDTLPRIPIQVAMQQLAALQSVSKSAALRNGETSADLGAILYGQRCAECHGANGDGVAWRHISVAPYRYSVTAPLAQADTKWSNDRRLFGEIVTRGLPGDIMPGFGTLTQSEIDELYIHVRSFGSAKP